VNAGGSRIVVIGDEVWMGDGDQLEPAPPGLVGPMLATYDPALLVGAFALPGTTFGANEIGTEEKNGVQTTHYQIDGSTFTGTIPIPATAVIDFWVAEDGYLASMSVTGQPQGDWTIDVTDVNAPDNVVERPD
jgi:hypothetical protein